MPRRRFEYPPLEEHDSIRLLRLYGARGIDHPLCVDIIQRTLSSMEGSPDETYAYTALSYCWGPQGIKRPVLIGSDVLFIGQNLSDALCHLRKVNSDIFVWADGLCINQEDVLERSRQVKLMRYIYSKAEKTIVFLGIGGGNTYLSAWNYLERESSDPKLKAYNERESGFRGDLQDVEIDVLSRPWFCRVWVMQEVVVSKSIFVQSGQRVVSWDDFCKTVLLSPRVNDRYGFSLRNHHLYSYVADMFSARSAFLRMHGDQHLLPPWYDEVDEGESRSDSVLDMLSRARLLEATDPRDKIFALLGISSGVDHDDEGISIDYSLPVVTVYRNFARFMIESTQSYDIFSYLTSTVSDKMPSWVPDWRLGIGLTRTILSTLPPEDKERFRSRQLLVRQNHDWLETGGYTGKSLLCVGRIIAKITDISSPILLRGDEEWGFERLREIYKDDPKAMQKVILRKWEKFPWRRIIGTFDPVPADLTVGTSPELPAALTMPLPPLLGMGNRASNPLEATQSVPNLPKSDGEQPFYDDFFNHEESNMRSTFLPPGIFVPPTWPAQTSLETSAFSQLPNRDSKFSKERFKRLFQKQPKEVKQSTSTTTTDDSADFDVQANSIEDHLLQRSRKTVQWTNDSSLAADHPMTTKSSIIDGRCFAKCVPTRRTASQTSINQGKCIALVSPAAKPDDLIVTLKGGRIAYVIKPIESITKDALNETKFAYHSMAGLKCKLVGECLINDTKRYDIAEQEKTLNIPGNDNVFIFQEWLEEIDLGNMGEPPPPNYD